MDNEQTRAFLGGVMALLTPEHIVVRHVIMRAPRCQIAGCYSFGEEITALRPVGFILACAAHAELLAGPEGTLVLPLAPV